MSTDQYPEVSSDDSGLVPQNAPKPEWPKKIRTLSAAELDRLTIDSDGRFYWDGHPVQGPQLAQPAEAPAAQTRHEEPVDLDALALLDRAARELSGKPAPEPTVIADAPPAAADEPVVERAEEPPQPVHANEPTVVALAPPVVVPEAPRVAPVSSIAPAAPAAFDIPYRPAVERVRVRMSIWQSLALLAVILGLLVGAIGIAVSGLVAAHEWGCRTKLVEQYCPAPPPPPAPPARFDIPA